MIEALKYSTIAQIYIKNLVLYNRNSTEECIEICKENGFSYLPGSDRKSIYKFDGSGFIQSELTEDLRCNPWDRLFDNSTLEKFENGTHDEVMFVMEKGIIKGVVHIVDYNNSFIFYELYKLFFTYEKMIRKVLSHHGLNNFDFIDWVDAKSRSESDPSNKNYLKKRYKQLRPDDPEKRSRTEKKMRESGAFQTFYFKELYEFTVSKGLIENRDGLDKLRNWVAHNKDVVKQEMEIEQPLYSISSLKEFVNYANVFFEAYEELESNLDG